MKWQRWAAGPLCAAVIAIGALLTVATPAAAECGAFDPWPSFTEAAPSARRILIGKVVESYANDSADNAVKFRVRVNHVFRGSSPSEFQFHDAVKSGAPLSICPENAILRVRVGDVIALAFDGRITSTPDLVLAVAWLRGKPDADMMPGSERLTLAKVRELAGLPATDALSGGDTRGQGIPFLPLLVVSLVGGFAMMARLRQSRGDEGEARTRV